MWFLSKRIIALKYLFSMCKRKLLLKLTMEEEMVGWHHQQFIGYVFERVLGVGGGQGSLVCYSACGYQRSDKTCNWTELKLIMTYSNLVNYVFSEQNWSSYLFLSTLLILSVTYACVKYSAISKHALPVYDTAVKLIYLNK